jgi:hypothetical protein
MSRANLQKSRILDSKVIGKIVNTLGFAFHFARPPIPSRAPRGEGRIQFELFLKYTAS